MSRPHRIAHPSSARPHLARTLALSLAALTLAACASTADVSPVALPTGAPTSASTPGVATPTSAAPVASARVDTPSAAASSPAEPSSTPSATLAATARVTAAQIVARSTIPVLCYHQIRTYTKGDNAYARSITTPPKRFTDQVRALKQAGFHAITPDQLRAHLVSGAALPDKPVLITFDDGTRPQWTTAGPILQRAGYTATYFTMTVVLNKDEWLRDSDLRAMHAAGFAIGSHTWDHHDVRDYTKKDWRIQLDGSLRTLDQAIGAPVTTFAYPYGAWNDAALAPLAARGITLAFQLTDKPVSPKAPLLTQRRLLMNGAWSGKDVIREIKEHFPQS